MQFPVAISVVSDSLPDESVLSSTSDTLDFIFRPIHDVFRNPHLAYTAKLRCLGALELEYTKSIMDMCNSGRWEPFGFLPNIDHISNANICSEILIARRLFSERAGDVILVSFST